MTQVTPPGWYPDPGQTTDGSRTERWWDGGAWTDRTRVVGAAPGWGPPAYPPGVLPPPPGHPRRGLRTAIAAGVAVVVLACIGGGVYVLTDGGRGGGDRASSPSPERSGPRGDGGGSGGLPGGPGGLPGGPGGPADPQDPDAPQDPGVPTEDGFATDLASGISMPVPKGWKGQSGLAGASVTTGAYKCPGDASQSCVRGGVFSAPAEALKLKGTTAKAAAEEDIPQNAKDSYGGKIYGDIASHDELASGAVDVAGQQGYFVRWKVDTAKGDDGYVESLAFPSPADSATLVVVRFGFDVNDKAPKVSTMDEITKGIKKAAASGGGGGSGKSV